MSQDLTARHAIPDDAAAIARIYNEGIEDRVATLETRLRTEADVRAWFDGRHPIVVVERDGAIVAYASSGASSARAVYAQNAHFSVFVARDARGQGAGRVAIDGLMNAARAAGFTKLVSGVFPENAASRALLRKAGFREVGTHEKHGRLDGAWRDVVLVERLL